MLLEALRLFPHDAALGGLEPTVTAFVVFGTLVLALIPPQ